MDKNQTSSATTTMVSTHARYFNEIASLTGGHFPTVHYLGSRSFDQFLWEVKQYVKNADQRFYGTDDMFHFMGVRIIRTGEP